MTNLFKRPKAPELPKQPSPSDERARSAALREMAKDGGRATTLLTSGLVAPMPRAPEVKAPRTVLTS